MEELKTQYIKTRDRLQEAEHAIDELKQSLDDALGAEDLVKLAAKYEDKNLEKDTAITGIASLTNAFGRTGGFSTVFGSYNPR